jgi:hypothetical protein
MNNKILILLISSLFFIQTEIKAQNNKAAGFYEYKSECLGVELDGSQTLKVWGSGRNRADAIEQAKKNGMRDVIFKGIREGKQDCNMKPLVPEVNAQEKYEDYFNKFFADEGEYNKFVSSKDGSKYHTEVIKDRKQAGSQETYAVIIRVLRAELKSKLLEDNILKPVTN